MNRRKWKTGKRGKGGTIISMNCTVNDCFIRQSSPRREMNEKDRKVRGRKKREKKKGGKEEKCLSRRLSFLLLNIVPA